MKKTNLISVLMILICGVLTGCMNKSKQVNLTTVANEIIAGADYYRTPADCEANNYSNMNAFKEALNVASTNEEYQQVVCSSFDDLDKEMCLDGAFSVEAESQGMLGIIDAVNIADANTKIFLCTTQAITTANSNYTNALMYLQNS